MRRTTRLGALLGAATALGCAALGNHQSVDSRSLDDGAAPGLAYWLPKAAFRVKLEVKKVKDDLQVELSIAPEAIADTTEGLQFLQHETNWVYSDKIYLAVDERGLLRSVSAEAEDQTGEIVATLGKIATNVAKIAMGVPPFGMESFPAQGTCDANAFLESRVGMREWVFTGSDNVNDALDDSAQCRTRIAFRVEPLGVAESEPDCPAAAGNDLPVTACTATGVKFRVPVPVKVSAGLQIGDADGLTTVHQVAAVTIAPSEEIFALTFERVDFVRSVRKATFEAGMLRSLDVERPSPLLGFLEIPLEVAERVLAAPGQLLTFRIENVQKQTELLEAQTKAIEAAQKLQASASTATTP